MGLRIVQYDPNDYKLSAVLSSGAGDELKSAEQISAAFSLYFQWQKESPSWVRFAKDSAKTSRCLVSRDEEERELTQIFLSVPISELGNEKFYQNAFVRLVVFETCFEFESEIIDAWIENEAQWLIVQVPQSVKVLRARKSPRTGNITSTDKVTWIGNTKIEGIQINSVGLNSIVLNSKIPAKQEGLIQINNLTYKAFCVRGSDESSYLEIQFTNDNEAGRYFEFYARFRYPNLKSRSQFAAKDVLALYEKSGFFSNFRGSFDEESREQKTISTWESIKAVEHQFTADFCLEKESQLVGASSLGLCLKNKNQDLWVFHQLCSDKDKSTHDDTGELYTWRAEYLWSKKANATSIFWFRSTSRWLERIYVKYLMQNPTSGELREGNAYSYVHKYTEGTKAEVQLINFGDEQRAYCETETVLAGAGPDYVHANRNMNIITSLNGNWDEVHNIANSICSALNRQEMYFRVDLPVGMLPPDSAKAEKQVGSDRFARIDKAGMLDLVTCIKHSVAVTKSKKGVA